MKNSFSTKRQNRKEMNKLNTNAYSHTVSNRPLNQIILNNSH